ncbi:MAG: hypothetical protein JXR95_10215, partial [Deltaproteobacteria bacterium]|nr:hypothetical protein [Deltaproteobacteria bacterium]
NLVVRGNLGYLMKSWSFSDKTTLDVPGVSYSAINLTLGARFLIIDKANVEGNISFMMPLDAGDIASADFYGQATLMGLRFNVAFGYEVLKGVEVLAGFDYTRFDFTFDGFGARTADSASDQYISFLLGVRYTM